MLRMHRSGGGVGVRASVVTPLLWAVLIASPARAGAPEDPLVFFFGGDHRIWVLEGEEQCAVFEEDEIEAERCFELDLVVDARGRYQGSARIEFDGVGFSGELVGPVKGRQGQRGRRTELLMAARLEGVVEVAFPAPPILIPARIDLRCRGRISAEGGLEAPCALLLKLPGARPTRSEIPLAARVVGGGWQLTIQSLIRLAKGRLEGSATDSFGFSYQVRGKYDDRKDRSNLQLKGLRASLSKGAKVQLKQLITPAPEVGVGRAKYKLLGTSGKTPVSTEAED